MPAPGTKAGIYQTVISHLAVMLSSYICCVLSRQDLEKHAGMNQDLKRMPCATANDRRAPLNHRLPQAPVTQELRKLDKDAQGWAAVTASRTA